MSGGVDVWVIYDHPLDFPEHFVVRRQTANHDGTITVHPEAWLRPSLSAAREVVVVARVAPHADVRFGNDPDPHIAEAWL